MLADHHLKAAAFAMCEKKYGARWHLKARVLHISIDEKDERKAPYDYVRLHEQIQCISDEPPEVAICFLETKTHNMVLIHNNVDLCIALDDGTANFFLQELAFRANCSLTQDLGFVKLRTEFPSFWKQIDGTSCGFHVLHFLLHYLFKGIDALYVAPKPYKNAMDWRDFASELSNLVKEMGHAPLEPELVDPPLYLHSRMLTYDGALTCSPMPYHTIPYYSNAIPYYSNK